MNHTKKSQGRKICEARRVAQGTGENPRAFDGDQAYILVLGFLLNYVRPVYLHAPLNLTTTRL